MCQVFGRHLATDRMVSGAYKSEFAHKEELEAVTAKVEVSTYNRPVNQMTSGFPQY